MCGAIGSAGCIKPAFLREKTASPTLDPFAAAKAAGGDPSQKNDPTKANKPTDPAKPAAYAPYSSGAIDRLV
ncbi:MAG: hypothetical protein U1E56_06805 [Bauldia sp.]